MIVYVFVISVLGQTFPRDTDFYVFVLFQY